MARQLCEQGQTVRALVRGPCPGRPDDREARPRRALLAGVELAVGDLDDLGSVSKAVTGAEATFLITRTR